MEKKREISVLDTIPGFLWCAQSSNSTSNLPLTPQQEKNLAIISKGYLDKYGNLRLTALDKTK